MSKRYEDLTFTDDFMFCKVLTTNPDLCHELLELIIGRKVGKFTRLDEQKPIEITSDGKGIRFDVYSEDDADVVYDCEMQTTDKGDLPKRSRYYQGMIDLNLIERGASYNELKKSYIIFISPFDIFGKGLHRYTFEMRCAELPEYRLEDESTKIFFCAGGEGPDISEDMEAFLSWLATGKRNENGFVNRLEDAVEKARKSEEWRLEFMTLLMRDREKFNEGKLEGRQEQAYTTALKLSGMGMEANAIAQAVDVSLQTVQKWLEGEMPETVK